MKEKDTRRGTGFLTSERFREQIWAKMEISFNQTVVKRTDISREVEVENRLSTGSSIASMAEPSQ